MASFLGSVWRGITAATRPEAPLTPAARRQRERREASARRQQARSEAAERKREAHAMAALDRRNRRENAVEARRRKREDAAEYRRQVAEERAAKKRRPGGRREETEWARLAGRFHWNPAAGRDPDVAWLLGTLQRNPSTHRERAMQVLRDRHGEGVVGRLRAIEYERNGITWRHEARDRGQGQPRAKEADRVVIDKRGQAKIVGPMAWENGRGFVG